MSTPIRHETSAGVAMIEAVIALVVVAGLIGIGAYVLHRHTTGTATISAPAGGTTESIDQLTANDAATEQQADRNADSHMQQDATSANSAVNNVGGAYDESTL